LRNALFSSLITVFFVFASATVAMSGVPHQINVQGILTDAGGTPVTSTVGVLFAIWNDPVGGDSLWSEVLPISPDFAGRFDAILGVSQPIPDSAFQGDAFLSMKVETWPELVPRQALVSVAYAYKAGYADEALVSFRSAPVSVNSAAIIDGTIELIDIGPNGAAPGQIMKWNGSVWMLATDDVGPGGASPWTVNDSVVFTNDAWGLLRGSADNAVFGSGARSMVNLGTACTTGVSGSDIVYATIAGGHANVAGAARSTVGGGYRNVAGNVETTVGGGQLNTASGAQSTVSGGMNNSASGWKSAVAGGYADTAGNESSTVGGGESNAAQGEYGTVSGGRANKATAIHSTIGGGAENIASDNSATVAGGFSNWATGYNSTVAGGVSNSAEGYGSTVGGGNGSLASGAYSTIGGGYMNSASAWDATVAGGEGGQATGYFSSIGGGYYNSAPGYASTVGGGQYNHATDTAATIAGGSNNHARGVYSFVGGGGGINDWDSNSALGSWSVIGGGHRNYITGEKAFIGCGEDNLAQGNWSAIAGGSDNKATGYDSFIGGGTNNEAVDEETTIGGGYYNIARSRNSTIGGGAHNETDGPVGLHANATVGGGHQNKALHQYATIAGGGYNQATAHSATIGGGMDNRVTDTAAVVCGGSNNFARGIYSVVCGGGSMYNSPDTNAAHGRWSVVAGGRGNVALGDNSFVAGRRAQAWGDGSFVWADNTDADFVSSTANEFAVRAGSGVRAEASNSNYGAYFNNAGGGDGIRTYATTSSGSNWAALYAYNLGSSPAIYGYSSSGDAAYFAGPVTVTGYLTKGGGGFKIDHPLTPTDKYLNHSFVESPDMKNVYDGVVALDAAGEAWITLPDWFGVLNKDFRYQLTCIGAFAPVYIAQEIADNRFKIAGGSAGMKVSWQVTGIRQDDWANAHRLPVEENKSGGELGKYLHPKEHGRPESAGIVQGPAGKPEAGNETQ
jgi:hypothetical protein